MVTEPMFVRAKYWKDPKLSIREMVKYTKVHPCNGIICNN